MLKELSDPAQRAGEPRRRWFSGESSDLTIWLSSQNEPDGFQFSFQENNTEHALTWRPDQGLEYHAVDAGETDPKTNRTPLLVPNGQPHWASLESIFRHESGNLDSVIQHYMNATFETLRSQGTSWAGRESDLAPYCRWVDALNQHEPGRYVDFRINGQTYGHISRSLRAGLISHCDCLITDGEAIAVRESGKDFESLSADLETVADYLHAEGHSRSRMSEPYPVTLRGRQESIAEVDRTIVGQLGLRNFSQHINGFVRKADGVHLWIGQRAKDKPTWPGKRDQMVAGGLPSTVSLRENVLKECYEEAGVPAALAQTAIPVGSIRYRCDTHNGLRRDIIFCYDLELPEDFVPTCTDGEVDRFELLPIEEVANLVAETESFKANCNLVMIDFLIRHGFIDPEASGYAELCSGLKSPNV